MILNHQNSHGATGTTPEHFPSPSQLKLDPTRSTLIMFAHPRCPCTRASLEELNRLLARSQGKVAAQIWFFTPSTLPREWARTDLWKNAAAISGVTVHEDRDGAKARLFGAKTSGHIVVYDARGELRFQGGITGSRGHAGDNAGESAIVSLLAGQDTGLKETRVYGCALSGASKGSILQ